MSGRISWPWLIAGAVVTMALSLSVHAVILQELGIAPTPPTPHANWLRLPDAVLFTLAAVVVARYAPWRGPRRGLLYRAGWMFLLLATLRETLFRAPFMEFVNLTRYTLYPFIDNLPSLLPLAFTAVAVEAWAPRDWRRGADAAVATVIAVTAALLVKPLVDWAFQGVLAFTSAREGVQRYGLPYDWHILVPAYATFGEPVIAAVALALAIRARLPARRGTRFLVTAGLILAIKGPVLKPLLNLLDTPDPSWRGFVGSAQFMLEALALGSLTAANAEISARPPRPAPSPPPLVDRTRG